MPGEDFVSFFRLGGRSFALKSCPRGGGGGGGGILTEKINCPGWLPVKVIPVLALPVQLSPLDIL